MKRKFIPILGLAGLAVSGLSAHAQITYNDGDLFVAFSQASATADVEIDLGSLSYLQGLSGGSTVSLGNISSDLTLAGASLNSLTFSVFGLQNAPNGSIAGNTSWLSLTQTGASPNAPTAGLTPSKQNALQSNELGTLGLTPLGNLASKGLLPWSAANAAGANNTASTAIIPNSDINSYSKITAGSGNIGANVTGYKNTTSGTFVTDGGSITSDLFEYDPTGTANPSVYQGYFTLNSLGVLSFTAVPEPGTCGMLAVGGLLLISLRNKFRRQQS
jgi:hypothetical protein